MKRLYPHFVVDAWDNLMNTHRLREDVFRPERGKEISDVFAILREAAVLDFCEVKDYQVSTELTAFAAELSQRGLFRLPFPACALVYVRYYAPNNIRSQGGHHSICCLLMQEHDAKSFAACFFTEIRDADEGETLGAVPMLIVSNVRLLIKEGNDITIRGKVHPILTDKVIDGFIHDENVGKSKADLLEEFITEELSYACSLIVMLMSKGVEVRSDPAPDKLNRKRARLGRAPIMERRTVRITVPNIRYVSTDGGDDMDIHDRKSPRMHWRRGHFRTLHSGKVVPVSPSLVNAVEGAFKEWPQYEAVERSVPNSTEEE